MNGQDFWDFVFALDYWQNGDVAKAADQADKALEMRELSQEMRPSSFDDGMDID